MAAWYCFLLILWVNLCSSSSAYEVCGGVASQNHKFLANAYSRNLNGRLNQEAIITAQLASSGSPSDLTKQYQWLLNEVATTTRKTDIGKLAYNVLAAKALCRDPGNFGGTNLTMLVEKSFKHQYPHGGSSTVPRDGFYSVALGIQAICLTNARIGIHQLKRIISGQDANGGFGHSLDTTSQMVIAMRCLEESQFVETRHHLGSSVRSLLRRARSYLLSAVSAERSKVYFGNKFSTPLVLLGLKESLPRETPAMQLFCGAAAASVFETPISSDALAWTAQRLQALLGKSVLALKTQTNCVTFPDEEDSAVSTRQPSELIEYGCNANPFSDFFGFLRVEIAVTLSLLPSPHLPNATGAHQAKVWNVPNVAKDSTLLQVLRKAQCEANFRFAVRMTSWGPMLAVVDGREASDKDREYWAIVYADNDEPLSRGLADYLPSDQQRIGFKLSTY